MGLTVSKTSSASYALPSPSSSPWTGPPPSDNSESTSEAKDWTSEPQSSLCELSSSPSEHSALDLVVRVGLAMVDTATYTGF